MLNLTPCREFLNSTGYSIRTLKIPALDMSSDLRELIQGMGVASNRNTMNFLFLPCADKTTNNVQMYVSTLSQREDIDNHKYRVRHAADHLSDYNENTMVIGFVNFKSINAGSRAALKEYVTATYGNAEAVNCRYMVIHPQCDVAVYKFPNNKFLILTNTFNREFLEAVYAMLWINHSDTTATPEMADALLRGDEDTIIGYINSLIAARVEGISARRYNFFSDKLKGIMVQRDRSAALEGTLNATREEIERLTSKLEEQFIKRKDILNKIKAIQTDVQENVIEDLLLMLKPEDIISVNEEESSHGSLYFVIKSKFTYWDMEDYRIMRDRRDRNTNFLSRFSSEFVGFLDEIFINKTYTLMFNTPLVLYQHATTFGNTPTIGRGNTTDVSGVISNPHIYHYNCWGDNGGLIARAFDEGDFITGWGVILSAISAVNISDTPVMTRFVNDICDRAIYGSNTDKAHLIKKDGTELPIYTAYQEYLAKANAANN